MSTSLHCPRCETWHDRSCRCDPGLLAEAIQRSFDADAIPADEQEAQALGRWRART
jgi:hypothetical protein